VHDGLYKNCTLQQASTWTSSVCCATQTAMVVAWRRAILHQLNSEWSKKSKQAKWVPVSAETLNQVRAAMQTDKEKQK
jgi:hypothetical protein